MNVIKSKYGNASFWLDKFDTDVENDFLTENEKENHNLFALASRKRAISNYVSILTGKSYPVTFKTRGDSYTDGDHIVISSNIEEPQDFDIAVGLALHEASHIKLSDFEFLKNLESHIENKITSEVEEKLTQLELYNHQVYPIVKDILNYVEDRRIDNFVYRTSPGYRDYYIALYDKYFNSSLVEKGLKSDEYTDETFDSYMFRLINLHSKSAKLDSLNGLREIYNLINLRTIGRLKTSEEVFEISWKIFEIILKNIVESQPNQQDPNGQPQSGDSQSGDKTESQEGEGNETQVDDEENDEMGSGGSPMAKSSGSKSSQSTPELSQRQKELLDKKIKKQKDFLKGDISKKAMSKKDQEKIEMIDQSGTELKSVGQDYTDYYGRTKSIDCILVKKVDERLMMSEEFPYASLDYWTTVKTLKKPYQEQVENGIRLGTVLSRKLQTRSESRDTIFNRQKTGKIDRRMISTLGFGNQNVFFTKDVDFYNDANLHISIDASGSMHGEKWEQTLTNVVALCKAVDMIPNLQIQVSLRSCHRSKPYIAMVYDSRVDSFMKVKKLFPCLHVSGTTPEGLTFEAILDEMVKGTNNVDSYFVNISDGEPYFQSREFYYSGDGAAKHTRKMVNNIREMGIKVISYFVSDSQVEGYAKKVFDICYGKSANFIDVTSVNQVSKTMNKMFLEKKVS